MISAGKFYSSKKPSRSTLLDARSHAESSNIKNIFILPPDSGNLDSDNGWRISWTIECSRWLFEAAGELEIEHSESDDCSHDETVPPKKLRNHNSRCWKAQTFSK